LPTDLNDGTILLLVLSILADWIPLLEATSLTLGNKHIGPWLPPSLALILHADDGGLPRHKQLVASFTNGPFQITGGFDFCTSTYGEQMRRQPQCLIGGAARIGFLGIA